MWPTLSHFLALSHLFRCSCSRSSLCSISPNVMSLSQSSPPSLSWDFAESSTFPQGHSSTHTSRKTQSPSAINQTHTNIHTQWFINICKMNYVCMLSIVLHTHIYICIHYNKTYGTITRQIRYIYSLNTAPVSPNITAAIPRRPRKKCLRACNKILHQAQSYHTL